jgi:predicted O-methyltransferase YrrM
MSLLFTSSRYFNYRLKAYSAHGIHSPFVYGFITSLLRDRTPFYAFQAIESTRSKMLLSKAVINKTDFGTGRRSGKTAISRLAKNDLLPSHYGQLLFRMIHHFRPNTILELGTSLGITTLYLSMPSHSARVITLEGCPETAAVANSNFERLRMANITTKVGEFSTTLPEALNQLRKLDFLYLDGNHSCQPTLDYFAQSLPFCHENSIVVFDDIHLNPGMESAWKRIKEHPQVSISIDLFKLGIVFFRTGVLKQHFILKF